MVVCSQNLKPRLRILPGYYGNSIMKGEIALTVDMYDVQAG
jgi:hypothetical protein